MLLGEDQFSLRHALEEIKQGLGDRELLAVNTETLDGQRLTQQQLRAVCETVPFMAEKRLVIVNGLLGRFESRAKAGRSKKSRDTSGGDSELKSWAKYLCQVPQSTVLVLIDGTIKSSNPLLKEVSAGAVVKSFPPLRNTELRRWIQERVVEEGGSISRGAVELLAKLVGSDLWLMTNEINKLVLYTSGRQIEEEPVRLVVSHDPSVNVFAVIDAIFALQARAAEQLLHQLLLRGAAPVYLMTMLSRQMRMIVRAKELKSQGWSEMDIQKKLGLASEFALRRTLEQAARYPSRRLKEIYHKLLETDLSIKTGKFDGELALTIMVAELCQ
ncbi:DNA polymerase III subunit delta [Chloroflexota bacterium]